MSVITQSWQTTAQVASRSRIRYWFCFSLSRRLYSRLIVKENDIVLLKRRGNDEAKPILTKPLRPEGKIGSHQGVIDHADLIGKEIRDVVYTKKAVGYRIYQPTLAEYVTLSRRMVTPVYPADANLIVSLLDIHPPTHTENDVINQPFEIFEAGTGHGSLTLHLARAIHGLNPTPPPFPAINSVDDSSIGPPTPNSSIPNVGHSTENPSIQSRDVSGYDQAPSTFIPILKDKSVEEARFKAYLANRRAVIHTLDISPNFSKHAEDTIRKFRRGVYFHNIDFHVGTIREYLSSRLVTVTESFLEHAILDLPFPQEHLDIIGEALKPNGSLIIFCPSITQIAECVKVIGDKSLPFTLESVLELGAGAGVGGREWDLRIVKPRSVLKAEAEEASKVQDKNNAALDIESVNVETKISRARNDSGWSMVCRPKVGSTVTGGGFLGLWRRTAPNSSQRTRQAQSEKAAEELSRPLNGLEGDTKREI